MGYIEPRCIQRGKEVYRTTTCISHEAEEDVCCSRSGHIQTIGLLKFRKTEILTVCQKNFNFFAIIATKGQIIVFAKLNALCQRQCHCTSIRVDVSEIKGTTIDIGLCQTCDVDIDRLAIRTNDCAVFIQLLELSCCQVQRSPTWDVDLRHTCQVGRRIKRYIIFRNDCDLIEINIHIKRCCVERILTKFGDVEDCI